MSSNRLCLGRSTAQVQIRMRDKSSDGAATVGLDPAGQAASPRTAAPVLATSIKDLQRRAFERGRTVEREESGEVLRQAATAFSKVAAELDVARAADQPELEEFAVNLACTMAEILVGRIVEEGSHDVRALARQILVEIMPGREGEGIVLHGHPDDIARLDPRVAAAEGLPAIKLAQDGTLAPGEFRARGSDLEYYSGIHERLAEMRERLLSELKVSHAS